MSYRTHLSKLFDPDLIPQYVAKGLITCRQHPKIPELSILNYTPTAQFSGEWDDVTRNCRGLVINNGSNEIIARPFPKFHNLEEYDDVEFLKDLKCISVQDKLDGSLGILVPYKNTFFIATRGSFVSDQALKATHILNTDYKGFISALENELSKTYIDNNVTYLCEIIYPENRIVIDYGQRKELVLLSVINNETGRTLNQENKMNAIWKETRAAEYIHDGLKSLTDWHGVKFLRKDDGTTEGYVLVFAQPGKEDLRIKLKYDEYKRLHKLLTGINEKKVWEALAEGTPLSEMLGSVPDEFYDWVVEIQDGLLEEFRVIDEGHYKIFKAIKDELGPNALRKQYADEFKARSTHPSILFAMLDEKDYAQYIYKIIKPEINMDRNTYVKDLESI